MFRNSLYYLLSSFTIILLNFVTLPFFTKYLSLSDYGVMALFLIFGSIVTNVLSLGINTGIFRYYFNTSKKEFAIISFTSIIYLIIVFSFFYLLVIIPFSDWISETIFNNSLSEYLLKVSFLNGCLSFFYLFFIQILIAKEKASLISILYILHSFLNLGIAAYLILFQALTLMALIYGIIIANSFLFLITFFINLQFLKMNLSVKKIIEVVRFSYPETLSLIFSSLLSSFDRTMLVNYKTTTDVGHFEFGMKFAAIFKTATEALSKSWSPFFLKNAEKRNEDSCQNIVNNFYLIFFIISFGAIGISYFSEDALILLTTEEFHIAKYIIPLLIIKYYVGCLTFLSFNQIMTSNKLIINLILTFAALVLNIILNIYLIPLYGVVGAISATLISGLIHTFTLMYYGQKYFPLPINIYKLLFLVFLVLIFIIFGYLVMYLIETIFIKILLKIFLMLLFLRLGFLFRYFDVESVSKYLNYKNFNKYLILDD